MPLWGFYTLLIKDLNLIFSRIVLTNIYTGFLFESNLLAIINSNYLFIYFLSNLTYNLTLFKTIAGLTPPAYRHIRP